MAVDRDNFLAAHPEFESATEPMVRIVIADAINNVDEGVFKTKTDQAVRLLAAHYLAVTPFGRNARLSSKEGNSTYMVQFKALTRSMTPGFRVA